LPSTPKRATLNARVRSSPPGEPAATPSGTGSESATGSPGTLNDRAALLAARQTLSHALPAAARTLAALCQRGGVQAIALLFRLAHWPDPEDQLRADIYDRLSPELALLEQELEALDLED
jgi:hypothetical protein